MNHQHTHPNLALRLALGWLLLVPSAAAAQATIYPPSGTGGSYVIAVVSDGFTANESWQFDRAVNGLVLNGLMADPFYMSNGAKFTIKKIFKAVTNTHQSSFQFTPNYDIKKCYVDYTPQTTGLIEDAVKIVAPERVIVIGNYEGVSMGCSVDTWTYVSAGAREVGGVLEHEFGHLIAGLFDEYWWPDHNIYPGPDVDGPNCSNVYVGTKPSPIWSTISNPAPVNAEGCRYYREKIVRPYDNCRMRGDNPNFCYVCALEMTNELGLFVPHATAAVARRPMMLAGLVAQQPPPPPSSGRVSVRLLVRIDKQEGNDTAGAKATIVSVAEVPDAPVVHRYRRVGDHAYGIIEDGKVIESAVLPGDPFQSRQFGGVSAPHPPADRKNSASVVVMIPAMRRDDLARRPIGIKFLRLRPLSGAADDASRQPITPERFREMMGGVTLAELTPSEVSAAVRSLP